jgi:hypothetical protein
MEKRELLRRLRNLGTISAPDSLLSKLHARLEGERENTTSQARLKNNEHQGELQEEGTSRPQNSIGQTIPVQGQSASRLVAQSAGSAVACAMSLTDLAQRCTSEMNKYRRREPSDDQYCLEIFRRAVVQRENDAWAVLQRQFSENVRLWFGRHPSRQAALRLDGEQSYIDDALRRFWQAVSEQKLAFHTLASVLSYLHLCLNCAIMDALRAYSRPKEEPIPDYGQVDMDEPSVEESYQESELWEIIEALLPGEKERRMAFLHFHCNLKPREIIRYCPGEFSCEDEIYRLKRNIMERILRNADKIRWRLSGDEK